MISVLEKKVLLMLEERSLNTMEGRALTLSTEIKKTRDQLESLRNELKRKINIQKNVQKCRQKKKDFEERLKLENPDLAKAWKLRDGPGRLTIETARRISASEAPNTTTRQRSLTKRTC